jgi:hypothetical protein
LGFIDKDVYSGIKVWYSDLLTWLTTSYYGIDEKERGNNHGTWWSFQVAIISSFVQNSSEIKMLDSHSKHFLLDNQIDEDARQPLEEERTKSLSYSAFNLTAHSLLNSVLLKYDINNWKYVNTNGVTLIDVIEFLIPFIKQPDTWNHKQISSFDNSDALFLGYAGLQLNNYEYLKLFNSMAKYKDDRISKPTYDPIKIVLDLVIRTKLERNGK